MPNNTWQDWGGGNSWKWDSGSGNGSAKSNGDWNGSNGWSKEPWNNEDWSKAKSDWNDTAGDSYERKGWSDDYGGAKARGDWNRGGGKWQGYGNGSFDETNGRGAWSGKKADAEEEGGDACKTVEIEQRYVGWVLGKAGACIMEIEQKSGARIKVDQTTRHEGYSTATLRGSEAVCEEAERLIKDKIWEVGTRGDIRLRSCSASRSRERGVERCSCSRERSRSRDRGEPERERSLSHISIGSGSDSSAAGERDAPPLALHPRSRDPSQEPAWDEPEEKPRYRRRRRGPERTRQCHIDTAAEKSGAPEDDWSDDWVPDSEDDAKKQDAERDQWEWQDRWHWRSRSRSAGRRRRRQARLDSLYEAGAAVLLEGLGRPLAGQVGRLQAGINGSVAQVRLPTALGAPVVYVPIVGLRPLARGTPVEVIDGESSASSARGRVAAFKEDDGTYGVKLKAGGTVAVVPSAIRPYRLLDIPFDEGAGSVGAGEEHPCRFMDSSGKLRRFWIHLPDVFSAFDGETPWPLLLFMHGSVGGTLWAEASRQQRRSKAQSYGMEFVSSHFVTVSPVCEWTWKGEPGLWVLELIELLSAATWCDATRVYATGVSMGGMGCWELCAASPELFAAIAPVAAYHKVDRRDQIAEALEKMPIFAVQSPGDECCKFKPESKLYEELRLRGNPPELKANVTGGHSSTWRQAYDVDTLLWEFLLSKRRQA